MTSFAYCFGKLGGKSFQAFFMLVVLLFVFPCLLMAAESAETVQDGADVRAPDPAHLTLPERPSDARLDEEGAKMMVSFMYALSLLKTHYVDAEKVSYERMFQSALRGVMQDLDRFSNFETNESYESVVTDFSGRFGGIGVILSSADNYLEVVSVDPAGPADKAGLKAGDIIIKIDDKELEKLKLTDCFNLIRGEIGTLVTLSVVRSGEKDPIEVKVVRGAIENPSVVGVHIVDAENGVGYLRVKQFAHDTENKLDQALEELTQKGMKALVMDFRNNPGGLVEAAAGLCSRFLPADQPVVTLEWRDPSKNVHYRTKTCKNFLKLPIIVLVNGNSASAAELAASALRDYKRVVVLGETTFGKGSAQNVMPLGDLGALRMTIAHYYTPSHTKIHQVGLQPDITIAIPPADVREFNMQLTENPGVIQPEHEGSVRDVQLERALEVLKSAALLQQDAGKK